MTLVEGIGDELIQCLGIFVLLLVGMFLWWSTRIRELPQIRRVVIIDNTAQTVNAEVRNIRPSVVLNSVQRDQNISSETNRNVVGRAILIKRVLRLDRTSEASTNNEPPNHNEESSNSSNDTVPTENAQRENAHNSEETNSDSIRIRLKFLNDNQKLVDGRLDELLGDFKRRHFSAEISAQKVVRLIFNGHVLGDESTLRTYCLYDNCVVHCLIHTQQNTSSTNSQQQANGPLPERNLGALLYTCLSVLLVLAWLCRYNYSHLFNGISTFALIGLSGFYCLLIYGTFMPNENIELGEVL